MKSAIQSKLQTVLSYPFFERCGEPLPKNVRALYAWQAAAREANSTKWGNCRLMARNALFDQVQRKSWERCQEWDPIVIEVRSLARAFISDLIGGMKVPSEFADEIQRNVPWDIIFICVEEAFSDIVRPVFHIPVLEPWYAAGHFPCGWDGQEFPEHWDGVIRDGRPMVF